MLFRPGGRLLATSRGVGHQTLGQFGSHRPLGSAAAAAGLGGIVGVSRYTIPAGASAAEIIAVLDMAAADAARRGGAVVFAAPGEQLILALQLWGGEGAGNLARLAPLSAVIRRQRGG